MILAGVSGCVTGWVVHAHTHSPGGATVRNTAPASSNQRRALTLQHCLDQCQALSGSLLAAACLGVDVEFNTAQHNGSNVVSCWLHTDLRRLNHKYRRPRVIQYIIVRCPQQQGLYSSPVVVVVVVKMSTVCQQTSLATAPADFLTLVFHKV